MQRSNCAEIAADCSASSRQKSQQKPHKKIACFNENLECKRCLFDHFNLPSHSKQHMIVCGLSLHQGSTERRKTLEQKFIFQIGTLNPHGINERFSFN